MSLLNPDTLLELNNMQTYYVSVSKFYEAHCIYSVIRYKIDYY